MSTTVLAADGAQAVHAPLAQLTTTTRTTRAAAKDMYTTHRWNANSA